MACLCVRMNNNMLLQDLIMLSESIQIAIDDN